MIHKQQIEKMVKLLEQGRTISSQDELRKAYSSSNFLTRGVLHKLRRAGFMEKIDEIRKGNPHLWKTTDAGISFKEILESYVNA